MKRNAIVRIVLFSVTILVLLSILVAGLSLRAYRVHRITSSGAVDTMAPISSETGSTVTVSPSGLREIEIDWAAGSVRIQPADVTDIEISETKVSDDKYAMRCKQSGSKLTIEYCEESLMYGIHINDSLEKDLTVLVPRDFALDALEVDAASAVLEVRDLTIREVDLDTASGECLFENCALEKLDLDTASGDLRITGTLNQLDCDAASASVYAVLENVPTRIKMNSMSGDLDLTLPKDAGFTAEIDGMSSDFSSDFATTIQNGRHVCGDGSCQIQMDAMSGNVIIRKGV